MNDRWEIGSEFHWMGLPEGPFVALPSDAVWYSLARHAITEVLATCGASTLWVPEYFCEDVVEHIQAYCRIKRYVDRPIQAEPTWETLSPAAGDIVLAVDYFGMRSPTAWYAWALKRNCILLEDYSHDPAYGFRHSRADFAVSSLRKTLPVPDGAILWSPAGRALPQSPVGSAAGTEEKFAAMVWKCEYLSGRVDEKAKGIFRDWQVHGERVLCEQPVAAPAPESITLCSRGIPEAWLERRRLNVEYLLGELRSLGEARAIQPSIPYDGGTPFAVVLQFETHELRERVRHRLIEKRIYCPVHWPAGMGSSTEAKRLSATLLTLISDQRYGTEDMKRIVYTLRKCLTKTKHLTK
jgi:hypothetical protein